jgi:hypothetical protein
LKNKIEVEDTVKRIASLVIGCLALVCPALEPAAASHEDFERAVKSALAPLAGKSVVGLKVVYLSADVGPWLDTGMDVAAGDKVTMVLDGKISWSKAADITIEPWFLVWARVGEKGPIVRGTRNTDTFVANASGHVYLKQWLSPWLDETGKYAGDPAPVNPDWGGGASVALIRWAPSTDPAEILKGLASAQPPVAWAAAELERLKGTIPLPSGWRYMPELGPAEIYREVPAKLEDRGITRFIDMHTKNDAAILQHDLPIDLTASTELEWKWKAEKLPSASPENTLATHDYMSIAVEFDNGQDLTYFWSSSLPVGTSFRCPIKGWDQRETHFVVRSGEADLNKWLTDKRNVFEDYKAAIGGAMPKRITRVWLIAVSLFRRGEGRSQFADMRLISDQHSVPVW